MVTWKKIYTLFFVFPFQCWRMRVLITKKCISFSKFTCWKYKIPANWKNLSNYDANICFLKFVGHGYGGRESCLIFNFELLTKCGWICTVKLEVKPWPQNIVSHTLPQYFTTAPVPFCKSGQTLMFVAVISCHQAWFIYRRRVLLALMKFNLSCVYLRSLSARRRKFPTKRSKNRLEVALCFSLVRVTKIKCDHDSLEVELIFVGNTAH